MNFENYLVSHNIRFHPASTLVKSIASSRELLCLYEKRAFPDDYPHHEALNHLANMSALAAVVLDSIGTPFEEQVLKYLPLVQAGDPGLLTPGRRSRGRDLLFELVCAFNCNKFAPGATLQDPPDVLATHRGRCWGIACKVGYGKPETVAGRVSEGFRQLRRVNVDYGLVAVDLTNVFPHDRMYEVDTESRAISSLRYLKGQSLRLGQLLQETAQPIERAFLRAAGRTRRGPGVGIMFVVRTLGYHRATRTVMGAVLWHPCWRVALTEAEAFVGDFNKHWQGLAWPQSHGTVNTENGDD